MNDYGVIYASAQKNIGGPGVTLLLIRDDLLHLVDPRVPDVLAYEAYWKKDGMYNTPNTFGIYVCDLVIKWLLKQGGLQRLHSIISRKLIFYITPSIIAGDFIAIILSQITAL